MEWICYAALLAPSLLPGGHCRPAKGGIVHGSTSHIGLSSNTWSVGKISGGAGIESILLSIMAISAIVASLFITGVTLYLCCCCWTCTRDRWRGDNKNAKQANGTAHRNNRSRAGIESVDTAPGGRYANRGWENTSILKSAVSAAAVRNLASPNDDDSPILPVNNSMRH